MLTAVRLGSEPEAMREGVETSSSVRDPIIVALTARGGGTAGVGIGALIPPAGSSPIDHGFTRFAHFVRGMTRATLTPGDPSALEAH